MNDKPKDKKKWNSDLLRQFLLSLVATTFSILLTFGIAGVIDNKKKEEAKREIVLMVMYDMQQSIAIFSECDSNLVTFFNNQLDIIANPEKFQHASSLLIPYFPKLNYPTTTENIFNSNIETINTVGSILFVQQVSSFYDFRKQYKKAVLDDFEERVQGVLMNYDSLAAFETADFPMVSHTFLEEMESLFKQCKVIMKVSDKELDAYANEQKQLVDATTNSSITDKVQQDFEGYSQRYNRLEQARQEGRRKLGR